MGGHFSSQEVTLSKQKEFLDPLVLEFVYELFGARADKDRDQKVVSVASDITYLVNPSIQTPKHLGLTNYLHHNYAKSTLIDFLHKHSYTLPYQEVRTFLTSAAKYMITEQQKTPSGAVVPSYLPGNDEDRLLISVGDNWDHNECTLSGKGSTHAMSSILVSTTHGSNNNPKFEFPRIPRLLERTLDTSSLPELVAVLGQGSETYSTSSKLSEVVIVILSQPNPYHADRARALQIDLMEQMIQMPKENKPAVYQSHRKWPDIGTWTIFPLLEKWQQNFPKEKWIFFCEDETRIHLKELETFIQGFDPNKEWFIGRALFDKEPTIIHHFTSPEKLTYPDFAAGVFLSFSLINKLVARWPDERFRADFAIDPKHELASYILLDDIRLTHAQELCLSSDTPGCVTYINQKFPDCGSPVGDEDLFVAVKTCEKFHTERVPFVLQTWAQETSNIEFYSEKEDKSIPTIDLGVPNTERGHCGKTMAIMKRAVTTPEIMNKKWLLIADDDTIINLPRLRHLLSCYDPDSHVALGERYGYGVAKGYGYDYITGGGGMVFSMPVVQRLADECPCPADESPDDMIIGLCLRRFEIPITHLPYFHQARPDDYSEGYLSRQIPVSFHKHWNCDPIKIYNLLKQYDSEPAGDSTSKSSHAHTEL